MGNYADVQLHAGLICVTTEKALNRDGQQEVFRAILDKLEIIGDLVNSVLEVEVGRDLRIRFRRYQPPDDAQHAGGTK
jgi:hypothetical protein